MKMFKVEVRTYNEAEIEDKLVYDLDRLSSKGWEIVSVSHSIDDKKLYPLQVLITASKAMS